MTALLKQLVFVRQAVRPRLSFLLRFESSQGLILRLHLRIYLPTALRYGHGQVPIIYEQTYFYNPFLDSTRQNGQAFFAFSGIFDICLTVTNSLGSSTTCKQDYMNVMDAIQHCNDTISNSSAGFVTDEGGPGGNYANNRSLCTTNPCPANSCKGILIDPWPLSSVTLNFTP